MYDVLISVMSCVYIIYTAAYLEFSAIIPWTAAGYRKYDVNVIVVIHHKGGYWNCTNRIIRILESLTV